MTRIETGPILIFLLLLLIGLLQGTEYALFAVNKPRKIETVEIKAVAICEKISAWEHDHDYHERAPWATKQNYCDCFGPDAWLVEQFNEGKE